MRTFVALLVLSVWGLLPASGATRPDCAAALARSSHRLPWYRQIDANHVESVLSFGPILSRVPLRDAQMKAGKNAEGTHEAYLVTLQDGARTLEAVWKPEGYSYAEVGAYRAARVMGIELVPPTVLRAIAGRRGSLQYYVSSPLDLLQSRAQQRAILDQVSQVSNDDLNDRMAFYFILGQWDAHWGNAIVDGSYSLALIDNGAIQFHVQNRWGELPFRRVLRGLKALPHDPGADDPFPFDRAQVLIRPELGDVVRHLAGRVQQSEIEKFWRYRANKADSTLALVVWRGELWAQSIGHQNYGVMMPTGLRESTRRGLTRLNFRKLRAALPLSISDEQVRWAMERRTALLAHTR